MDMLTRTRLGIRLADIAPDPDPVLVDERTASRRLGLTLKQLREWADNGLMPFVRLGRSRRFHLEACKVKLAELAAETTQEASA